jgi:hypothetical protein
LLGLGSAPGVIRTGGDEHELRAGTVSYLTPLADEWKHERPRLDSNQRPAD